LPEIDSYRLEEPATHPGSRFLSIYVEEDGRSVLFRTVGNGRKVVTLDDIFSALRELPGTFNYSNTPHRRLRIVRLT
jgi:hypothetical protein